MKNSLILISFTILLTACATNQNAIKEAQNLPLSSTQWTIIEVNTQEIIEDQSSAYMVFDTTGNYYGETGCNKFFGSYFADKKKISLSYSGATKMLCHDMTNEQIILKGLKQEITRYSIHKDTLLLFTNNHEVVIKLIGK